jgi:hypothetical protein
MKPHAAYSAVATRVAALHERLPPDAFAVVRLCDGHRGLDEICADAPFPVSVTAGMLLRLLELHLVEESPARSLERQRMPVPEAVWRWMAAPASRDLSRRAADAVAEGAFSPEEEAFFARPVCDETDWDDAMGRA